MAHRRMISQDIVDTDGFATMSLSARYLYYELLVRADDDGFLGAPMRIARMVECTEKDLNELVHNGYIIKFETGIIVIRDWKIHNNIRKDIYRQTQYQNERELICEVEKRYYLKSECNVTEDVTENVTEEVTESGTLGKDRIGKNRLDINYQLIVDMYNATCVSFPKLTKLSERRKKAIKARSKTYTEDDFQKLFEMAERSDFLKGKNERNWSATFDWLISDGNMAKVLDGNYENKSSRQQADPPKQMEKPEYYRHLGNRPPSPDDPFQ